MTNVALSLLDLDRLVAPVPGTDPAGASLRFTPDYDGLAEARREDDDADLDKGIWQAAAKKADWRLFIDNASQILAEKSKDLQIAVWLGQALYRQHGLDGLICGIVLLRRLIEPYWTVIHPRPDEGDDDEQRLACLSWFDAQMARELFLLPIAEDGDNERPLTYQVWLGTQRLQRLAAADPRAYRNAVAQGEVTPETVDKAIARSSSDFYRGRLQQLMAVKTSLAEFEEARAAVVGGSAPSLSAVNAALDQLVRFSRDVLKKRGIETEAKQDIVAVDQEEPAAEVAVTAYNSTGPRTREEAYDMLARIADFLIKEEPHSPTSYLVRRAASWGHLSLEELYKELLGSTAEVQRLFSVLRLGGDRPET